MTIWKGKLKTEFCILVDYFYLPEFFNVLAIGQKYLSFFPPSFFNRATWSNNFSKFSYVNNFSVDYTCLYINWANTPLCIIPGYTFNFETTCKKARLIKVAIFFWCSVSINLPWFQRRSNKINTILYIAFENIANHTKYKKPNVPIIFIFSDWILIKQIIIFSTPFCCWRKQIFERMLPWGMSNA